MRIYYRQPPQSDYKFSIDKLSIWGCRFVHEDIKDESDERNATKKFHSHTEFEIHLIIDGQKSYQTEDGSFTVRKNEFLLIPPSKKHRMLQNAYPLKKCSLSFSVTAEGERPYNGNNPTCVCKAIPNAVLENIETIVSHIRSSHSASPFLIASRVFESIVLLLQEANIVRTDSMTDTTGETVDVRVDLAKQYIRDNICETLSVTDVASYCHIGAKQLTRLFLEYEKRPPAAFIRAERIRRIEQMLTDPSLTLKSISEQMNFPNEYCFNTFFRKHYGMSPGKYRKMRL